LPKTFFFFGAALSAAVHGTKDATFSGPDGSNSLLLWFPRVRLSEQRLPSADADARATQKCKAITTGTAAEAMPSAPTSPSWP